jgi:drug/metabolite transporter (DMT)-like permease
MTDANRPHPLRHALPLFLLAGVFLASLDATAKWLLREHSLLLVIWARYAGQMLVVTPYALAAGGPGVLRTRRLPLQLARSAMLLLATICFFGGLSYLPLAEATAISFLAPLFVVALSWPILGERAPRARWAGAIAGFVGVLIVLRPGSAVFQPAALLMIGMALADAFYGLLTRKLADENPLTSLVYSALVGTVGMTLALPLAAGAGLPSPRDGALLLLLGLLAGLGHWFLIRAYARAPAALLTPFSYLKMLWATVYGWLLFGQLPDALSGVGMSIIVAGGVSLAWSESRRPRDHCGNTPNAA